MLLTITIESSSIAYCAENATSNNSQSQAAFLLLPRIATRLQAKLLCL